MRKPTIEQIKRANAALGQHFFDADALRFFRCRVSDQVYAGQGGVYFVTSERCSWDHPRLYTVRQAMPDGSIETVGEFQQYGSLQAAKRAAREHAETLPKRPEAYELAA